jgi:hypothetical protein
VTSETPCLTEVRPADGARLTGKARDGGVGHDAQAGVGAILDDPRELVAEDEGTLESGIADRPFLVPPDVRAAQADCSHPQTNLSSPRAHGRFAVDPHVPRCMQPGDVDDRRAASGHRRTWP